MHQMMKFLTISAAGGGGAGLAPTQRHPRHAVPGGGQRDLGPGQARRLRPAGAGGPRRQPPAGGGPPAPDALRPGMDHHRAPTPSGRLVPDCAPPPLGVQPASRHSFPPCTLPPPQRGPRKQRWGCWAKLSWTGKALQSADNTGNRRQQCHKSHPTWGRVSSQPEAVFSSWPLALSLFPSAQTPGNPLFVDGWVGRCVSPERFHCLIQWMLFPIVCCSCSIRFPNCSLQQFRQ